MDVVNSLADSVHGSWGADSQIGHGHIIIYRSNEPHDPEVSMACDLLIRDAVWPVSTEISQLSQKREEERR